MSGSVATRPRRYALAAVSVVATTAVAVLGGTTPAQAAPPTWKLSTLPDLGTETPQLGDLSAVAKNDVWAVGTRGPKGDRTGMSLHYNGRKWTEVPTPDGVWMQAATMFDATHGVAVGGSAEGAQGLTWDGSTWTATPIADLPAGAWLIESDGVAPDDVWAVGNTGIVGLPDGQGFVEHFDGEQWTPAKLRGLPDGAQFSLRAVKTVSADDAWAVGTIYDQGAAKPLAYHWDGTEWILQDTGSGPGDLTGVTVLNGEVWAAGFAPVDNSPIDAKPLLMRLIDGQWTTVATPDETAWIYDLDVDGKGGLIATGYTQGAAVIMRWDGTTAAMAATPVNESTVDAVANVPGTTTTWVAGAYRAGGVYAAYTS